MIVFFGAWMLQVTYREARVDDSAVIHNLSASRSFFASTSILVIGGLLAVPSAAEHASELVREFPFAARTSTLVFDPKLVLLLLIFVHAFFRFAWSTRRATCRSPPSVRSSRRSSSWRRPSASSASCFGASSTPTSRAF